VKVKLFAEGNLNAALLERLVACHPRMREQGVGVYARETRSSVASGGQTSLSRWGLPTAVVVNVADSRDSVWMQRWELESELIMVAPTTEWRIVLLEPGVEGLLLRERGLLRELLPGEPSAEQLERARSEPRQVLAELYAQAGQKDYPQALLRRLSEVDLSPLWATPELHPLEEFLLEKLYAPPPPRPYPPPSELPPKRRAEPVDPAAAA
jgi:hypothetical protein